MRLEVIKTLYSHGPMPLFDIADHLGTDSKKVWHAIKPLRRRGLVALTPEQVLRKRKGGAMIEVGVYALASKGSKDKLEEVDDPISMQPTREGIQYSGSRITEKIKKRGGGPFGHLVAQMI